MTDYLNLPAVHDALHVVSEFYSVDNAEGDFDYTPTEPDLTGFYKEMNGKLRILVYNGGTCIIVGKRGTTVALSRHSQFTLPPMRRH